jgi:hypothetical protein
MPKEPQSKEQPMTALNAEISTQSMDMLKIAKVLHKRPIRLLVQEAIDQWLKAHGLTPDKLPQVDKPRK